LADGSEQPYAYTYGGQGNAIYWDNDGNPFIRPTARRTKPESEAIFNHGNGGGQLIADAMREQGFEVEWDGSDLWSVVVKFPTAA